MRLDRTAFRQGVSDTLTLAPFRWWLFKRLSDFGWWVCPEPHKSNLQAKMPTWKDLAP
ncbi:hypothetical protein [Ensifer adhaerens]|uniref:hypothetical protein n=1 Tax=Ensifer adhaerens TaxID=106592 RepID=UPI00131A46B0|nr:hypothetical protein [Ensifer adhaerens]